MKRRIISLAIAVLLLVSILSVGAMATNETSDGLEFELNNDGISYSVTGIGSCTDTAVVIPAEYEGKPVTAIGEAAFAGCSELTSIEIPESVTCIGEGAFAECSSLINVNFCGTEEQWNLIEGLQDCGLSEGVALNLNYIEEVPAVIEAEEPAQNDDEPASEADGADDAAAPAPAEDEELPETDIDDAEEEPDTDVDTDTPETAEDEELPETVVDGEEEEPAVVEGLEFALNDNGESYIVTGIGGCTDADVVIPAEYEGKPVTAIGEAAFAGCSELTSIEIPEGVICIGEGAFAECSSLINVSFCGTEEQWNLIEGLQDCALADSVEIHFNEEVEVEEAPVASEGLAFKLNDDFVSLSVAGIGVCTDTDVVLPSEFDGRPVTGIDWLAFSGCKTLTSITIPEGVTFIDMYAFNDCKGLTSIVIPESVTYFGGYAFYGCGALTDVYYGGSNAQWYQIAGLQDCILSGSVAIHSAEELEQTAGVDELVFSD